MSEIPTGTFGALPIGSIFRIPWTYAPMQKVDAENHNAIDAQGAPYQLPSHREVRQDWYITHEWEQTQEDGDEMPTMP